MKYKITIKELKNSSDLILNVGNDNIQTLLKYLSPYGYNYGCYGWNFDVYYFDNVDIINGYRCFKSGTLQPDFIVMRNYEERAKIIDNDR